MDAPIPIVGIEIFFVISLAKFSITHSIIIPKAPALEIAKACKNNVAIAIGLEDYTADIGVERTNDGIESLFARVQLVNAARSANIQAIDTVFSNINDESALRKSVLEAKKLGIPIIGIVI